MVKNDFSLVYEGRFGQQSGLPDLRDHDMVQILQTIRWQVSKKNSNENEPTGNSICGKVRVRLPVQRQVSVSFGQFRIENENVAACGTHSSCGSRIFQTGSQLLNYLANILPKTENCKKMKEFGPGGAPPWRPLDPLMHSYVYLSTVLCYRKYHILLLASSKLEDI